MSNPLKFQERIQGLFDYHQALLGLDPSKHNHAVVASPDIFHNSDSSQVEDLLHKARQNVLQNIGYIARVRYARQGLHAKDMTSDNAAMRTERADILALVTQPPDAPARTARAERVEEVLEVITSGQTFKVSSFDFHGSAYTEPEELTVDPSRGLYGVFANENKSSRTLTFQHDSPITTGQTDRSKIGEPVVSIEIPELFFGKPLIVEAI